MEPMGNPGNDMAIYFHYSQVAMSITKVDGHVMLTWMSLLGNFRGPVITLRSTIN